VILEDLHLPDVAPERVHALVARDLDQLEHRSPLAAALVRKPERKLCPEKSAGS
jgi:hypothetical protein